MVAEIYSLGVMLFHMVFKVFPFEPNSAKDENAKKQDFVQSFITSEKNKYKIQPSTGVVELLERMMEYNPKKRISIKEIRNCKWFLNQMFQIQNNEEY